MTGALRRRLDTRLGHLSFFGSWVALSGAQLLACSSWISTPCGCCTRAILGGQGCAHASSEARAAPRLSSITHLLRLEVCFPTFGWGCQPRAQLAEEPRLALAVVARPVSSETRPAPPSLACACLGLRFLPPSRLRVSRRSVAPLQARGAVTCRRAASSEATPGNRQRPRPRCCCLSRQAFFGRRAEPRGGPGKRSTQTSSGLFGDQGRGKWTWRKVQQ